MFKNLKQCPHAPSTDKGRNYVIKVLSERKTVNLVKSVMND
jgi:hypothetical protein